MLVHLHAGGEASSVGWHFLCRVILTNITDYWEWHPFPPLTKVVAIPPPWGRIHVRRGIIHQLFSTPLGKLLEYHHRRRPAAASHTVPFVSSAMLRLGIITDTHHRP